jgi:nitrite reductase/ring-hydroxylating ferredoxin subunit
MSGPLQHGTISGGCVTCPWHGSTFRYADGSIVRRPATNPGDDSASPTAPASRHF